jgi:hypothetical protein
VSTPSSPLEVGFCDTGVSYGVATAGVHAFVGAAAGLRVIDISVPSSPVEVGLCPTPHEAWGVAIAGEYAYVGALTAGVRVIDISTPSSPVEVAFYDTPGSVWQGVTVSDGRAFVTGFDAGLTILSSCTLFVDGFESGDTSAWSAAMP